MMIPETQLLERSGSMRNVTGHRALLLDSPGMIWVVIEGSGELVSTNVIDGHATGRRSSIDKVKVGDILFSMKAADPADSHGLMLISLDHLRVIEVSDEQLEFVASSMEIDSSAVLGAWASRVSTLLDADPCPSSCEQLQPETSVVVSPEQQVGPAADQEIWIHLTEGHALFLGQYPISSDDSPLVIPQGGWIEATDELQIEVLKSSAVAPNAGRKAIELLHLWIQDYRKGSRQRELESSCERIRQRDVIETKKSKHALAQLASVLNPQKTAMVFGDDLYSVMKLVGAEKGIKILPMAASTNLETLSNPAEAITRASRIQYRTVMFRGQWWKSDVGPLVGYLKKDGRPVAILQDSKGRYEIFDAGDGSRIRVGAETANLLHRDAIVLIRSLDEDEKRPIGLVAFCLRNKFPDLASFFFAAMFLTLLGMLIPQAMAIVLDNAIPNSNPRLLLELGGALVAVTLGMTILSVFQAFISIRISVATEFDAQSAIWDRLLRLKVSFFSQYSTGDLLQRVSAAHAISQELSGTTLLTLMTSFMALLNVALLFYYNAKLAVIAVGIALVVAVVTMVGGAAIRRHAKKLMEEEGELFGFEVQMISAVSKLRVAGAERRAFALWMERVAKQLDLSNRVQRVIDALSLFNQAIPMLSTLILFMLAIPLVTDQGSATAPLSIGVFLAFNTALGIFLGGALTLSHTIVGFLDTTVLASRMEPLLTAELETVHSSVDPGKLEGEVELSRIHFRYSPEGPKVLDGVSIHAKPGQFIALTGTSGCGKSTLMRLMLGFESPESGEIRFDGQDIESIDATAVRRQLGVVLQAGHIGAGSIFENITVGSVYTLEEAWQAAEEGGIADDIRQMPMQMHTVVSEGGSNLSGGQRQRLLICRALIRRPKILFLDEATSALDNRAQQIVNDSLNRRRVTRIVIAHRLSSIRAADCIYVLDRGRVVEQGNYSDLVKEDGTFAGLVARQTG
ncbi:MAG: NHLP bacteriocin export ABC transporter permease/ATPase subunit [Planctomycetota bacterium]|nr:NHLP bacteriocin export ABC transporter permease/ATPase subunit [Planctomycetota bacterium]